MGPYLGQIGPIFYKPDQVGRFITGLALDRLPYQGHIFPGRGPTKISARETTFRVPLKTTVSEEKSEKVKCNLRC